MRLLALRDLGVASSILSGSLRLRPPELARRNSSALLSSRCLEEDRDLEAPRSDRPSPLSVRACGVGSLSRLFRSRVALVLADRSLCSRSRLIALSSYSGSTHRDSCSKELAGGDDSLSDPICPEE